MKTKDKTAIKNATIEELRKRVAEEKQKLARLGVERYTKQSKNTREGRALRLSIAVAQTQIRIKELEHAA